MSCIIYGLDILDCFIKSICILKKLKLVESTYYIQDQLKNGKRILAEGAQGTMLDIDFGTYPFVTSSSTSIGGVMTGLGLSHNKLETVIGITKNKDKINMFNK